MITGEEILEKLFIKYPTLCEKLSPYNIPEKMQTQKLTHIALHLKIPVHSFLKAIAEITGEPLRQPKVKGLSGPSLTRIQKPASGLKKFHDKNIKKIIAVHSGKGGVGKTFVAINLALQLAKKNKVGLLDADIDCPNITKTLGISGHHVANANKKIIPMESHGLKIISMAPLLKTEDQAILWRGPVISKVVEQLIHDTEWGELDYLIIDMPPGTADIPLTILDIVEQAQILIVTTPQEVAVLDAKKSAHMATTMGIPIIGLLENMSGKIFGGGGGKKHKTPAQKLAQDLKINFIGTIPLKAEFAGTTGKSIPSIFNEGKMKNWLR